MSAFDPGFAVIIVCSVIAATLAIILLMQYAQ
jgi:hypothetical protein